MKNILFLIILTFSFSVFASPTKYWNLYKYSNFSGGTSKGVYLPSTGGLVPGLRSLEIKAQSGKLPSLFTSVVKYKGKIYISSGDPAQIWSIKNNKLTKLVDFKKEIMISKLVVAPKGYLIAATISGGKIYKVTLNGKIKLLAKLPVPYVWSLIIKGNNLYAGVGDKAEVYKINLSGGSFKKIWKCKEKHIMSLAFYKKGILIGTSPEARVYYLPFGSKKARLLYDFLGNEVRKIVVNKQNIYVATNDLSFASTSRYASKKLSKIKKYHKNKVYLTANFSKSVPRRKVVRGSGLISQILPNGTVSNLFSTSRGYFTSIMFLNNTIYSSDGSSGRIFAFDLNTYSASMVVEVKERQVLDFLFDYKNGGMAVTGDSAKVYSLVSGKGEKQGISYISPVLDAYRSAKFGKMIVSKTKGFVKIETRSGVTFKTKDDNLWNTWKVVTGFKRLPDGSESAQIKNIPARYFQYRITWKPRSKTKIRSIKIFFSPANLPARIQNITAMPETVKFSRGKSFVTDMVLKQNMRSRSGIIKIQWSVFNPDRDQLMYKLWVRKIGYKKWYRLSSNKQLTSSYYKWNAINFPEGVYQIKVEVSDSLSNLPKDTLKHSLVSYPVVVDNKPPKLTSLSMRKGMVRFSVKDNLSRIIAASYKIDSGDWIMLLPNDRIFDSLNEKFNFKIQSNLSKGLHLIEIRVLDESANLLKVSQEFSK